LIPFCLYLSAISQPPFYLAGEHHGYADEIRRIVEVDGFHIFIDKIDFHVRRQRRGKDDRTMGRQVKLRLPFYFFPFRIDQFKFHNRFPIFLHL